jgi:hypothetical protein
LASNFIRNLRLTITPAIFQVASEAPKADSVTKSTITYSSTFIKHHPAQHLSDPHSKERRRRLRDMTAKAFPFGQPFPDPYAAAWLTKMPQDPTAFRLPFVSGLHNKTVQ